MNPGRGSCTQADWRKKTYTLDKLLVAARKLPDRGTVGTLAVGILG